MLPITQLVNPFKDCENVTAFLLQNFSIKFSALHLQKELKEHPDYPSMASIADVLGNSYDVASAGISISAQHILSEPLIQTPFLATIGEQKSANTSIVVVTHYSADSVQFYHPSGKKEHKLSMDEFTAIFKKSILVVEKGELQQENGFAGHIQSEKATNTLYSVSLLLTPLITVSAILFFVITRASGVAFSIALLTVLMLVGCVVAAMLIWFEIDEYNPIVRQICQSNKKVNCAAVLNSKGAKIGGMSWSSVGFAYFLSLLTLLISGGFSVPAVTIAGFSCLMVSPYIIYSIYYQWKIAKQWCKLCLVVQATLLLQIAIVLFGGLFKLENLSNLSFYQLIGGLLPFAIILSLLIILLPALKKAKEAGHLQNELQKLKHNRQIFQALLAKQQEVTGSTAGLGITIGNQSSPVKLLKVCNPYCGPCAKTHEQLGHLLESNSDLSLQIIFTATSSMEDQRKKPVAHLMTIAEEGIQTDTSVALNNWYTSKVKDYEAFQKLHPLKSDINNQDESIDKMNAWCQANNISYTPTIFVCLPPTAENNFKEKYHLLPENYSVADLKYFLTV